jgi:hypothetical protein
MSDEPKLAPDDLSQPEARLLAHAGCVYDVACCNRTFATCDAADRHEATHLTARHLVRLREAEEDRSR